jgi:hypothetical protein
MCTACVRSHKGVGSIELSRGPLAGYGWEAVPGCRVMDAPLPLPAWSPLGWARQERGRQGVGVEDPRARTPVRGKMLS